MKKILGIWDGHDAGVAFVTCPDDREPPDDPVHDHPAAHGDDGSDFEVSYAANEERFTRRKLEVGFPALALAEAIEVCGEPDEIDEIIVASTEPAKMLSRIFPSIAKNYYLFRRHKSAPSPLDPLKRRFKARFTQLAPFPGASALTSRIIRKRLSAISPSLAGISVKTIDHHAAHLASAFLSSPFDEATVLSLDGIGDGASGAVALGRVDGHGAGHSSIREVARFSGKDSIGLIFEEATRLLHMRELEDEGKVMALASHADLDEHERGVLSDLVRVSTRGAQIRLDSVSRPERRLKETLWRLGPERFAAAVQAFAETAVIEIAAAAIKITGVNALAVAGGVFANVKINRLLREKIEREAGSGKREAGSGKREAGRTRPLGPAPLPTGSSRTGSSGGGASLWVFPHMGDGGLAFGAAVGHLRGRCRLSPYLGTAVNPSRAAEIAQQRGLRVKDVTLDAVAERIAAGEALGWINGRMEYGPRALGARSILARPDDKKIRDKLNLAQKKRVFYQPFCPTLLRKEALRSLSGYDGTAERWMTSLYGTNSDGARRLEGVIGPDGSCRPQILDSAPASDEEILFVRLINLVEQKIGIGGVLNTSYNVHGNPIVRTEIDAIDAFLESGLDALIAGGRIEITR